MRGRQGRGCQGDQVFERHQVQRLCVQKQLRLDGYRQLFVDVGAAEG